MSICLCLAVVFCFFMESPHFVFLKTFWGMLIIIFHTNSISLHANCLLPFVQGTPGLPGPPGPMGPPGDRVSFGSHICINYRIPIVLFAQLKMWRSHILWKASKWLSSDHPTSEASWVPLTNRWDFGGSVWNFKSCIRFRSQQIVFNWLEKQPRDLGIALDPKIKIFIMRQILCKLESSLNFHGIFLLVLRNSPHL